MIEPCADCGLQKAHFKCRYCGMHNALDNVPCIRCTYFRFDPVPMPAADVQAPALEVEPVPPPSAAPKTKRRPRGVADITQRN